MDNFAGRYIYDHELKEIINKAVEAEREEIRQSVIDIVYYTAAMDCGLEDLNITDRYLAMSYGWEKALDNADRVIRARGEDNG